MNEIRVRHGGAILPSWYIDAICKRLDNPCTNETFNAKLKKKYDILIMMVGTLYGNDLTNDEALITARVKKMMELLDKTPRIELK